MKRRLLIYMSLFLGTLVLCMSFLFLTSLIPTKVIKNNLLTSVPVIMNHDEAIPDFLENEHVYDIDVFADYMTIKMLYYIDSNHPILSALEVNCFHTENDFTFGTVGVLSGRADSNFSYFRYWHGNLGILRILYVFFNTVDIYKVFGVVLGILCFALLFILIKKKCYMLSCFITLAFFMTYSYLVPFCFEFYWMYFIGFLFAVFSAICYKKSNSFIYGMFIVMGVIVNFFDFFTIEVFVPLFSLLLIVYLRRKYGFDYSFKELLKFIGICLLLFLLSFSFTWIIKWIISYFLFHISLKDLFYNNILERAFGNEIFKHVDYPLFSTLCSNIGALFPFYYLPNHISFIVFIGIVFFVIIFKVIRKEFSKYSIIYLILFLVPYIRYLVLSGHSFQHSFFTFRSQFTSIIFLLLILFEKKRKSEKLLDK